MSQSSKVEISIEYSNDGDTAVWKCPKKELTVKINNYGIDTPCSSCEYEDDCFPQKEHPLEKANLLPCQKEVINSFVTSDYCGFEDYDIFKKIIAKKPNDGIGGAKHFFCDKRKHRFMIKNYFRSIEVYELGLIDHMERLCKDCPYK